MASELAGNGFCDKCGHEHLTAARCCQPCGPAQGLVSYFCGCTAAEGFAAYIAPIIATTEESEPTNG